MQFAPIALRYRHHPKQQELDSPRSGVLLSEEETARLQRAFADAIESELASGEGPSLATEPAAGVLLAMPQLVDVVVHAHRDAIGSKMAFVHNYGTMTFRLDLADSQSGQFLLRLEERRLIRSRRAYGFALFELREFHFWSIVNSNFRRWSYIFREQFEILRSYAQC